MFEELLLVSGHMLVNMEMKSLFLQVDKCLSHSVECEQM